MVRLFRAYKKILLESRYYIVFVILLASVWTMVGLCVVLISPSALPHFLQGLENTFRSIIGDIESLTKLDLAGALFRQNVIASLYDLFFGLFFGLVPVISIAFNFFALGFLLAPSIAPDLFPGYPGSLGTFLLLIVPHGIFEFPALILATAFGVRLGWEWILPQATGRRWQVLKSAFFAALKILPLIILLLVIAAFVESFITAQLA